ncbi:hypothetical protein SALBM311S_06124 [Streptomyces alboniger]
MFFTKNIPPGTPDWVTTAEVPRSEGPARMVLVQDLASLMWAANLVTEFHTHQWLVDAPAEADRIVFDLDPGAPATIVSAQRSRSGCASGSRRTDRGVPEDRPVKGLHLLAAVRQASSDQVLDYAKELAVEAERALPRLVVHRMTRSLRPGKVFVDWSQNAARKTTATPYTLRARAEPLVSAPVTWTEGSIAGAPSHSWLSRPRTSPPAYRTTATYWPPSSTATAPTSCLDPPGRTSTPRSRSTHLVIFRPAGDLPACLAVAEGSGGRAAGDRASGGATGPLQGRSGVGGGSPRNDHPSRPAPQSNPHRKTAQPPEAHVWRSRASECSASTSAGLRTPPVRRGRRVRGRRALGPRAAGR